MGEFYRQNYPINPKSESSLRALLEDPEKGAEARADMQQRMAELKALPHGRCVVSDVQLEFLQRVLGE